jgi:hypothetical protein
VLTVPIRWLKISSKSIGIANEMRFKLPREVVTVKRLLSKIGFFAALSVLCGRAPRATLKNL